MPIFSASFWKHWSLEYLSTLRKVYKWQHSTKKLPVDDVVLLIEEVMPTQWPFARVIKVYQGSDGIVRVADIRTSKAPIAYLCTNLPLYSLLKLNNINLLYVLNFFFFIRMLVLGWRYVESCLCWPCCQTQASSINQCVVNGKNSMAAHSWNTLLY